MSNLIDGIVAEATGQKHVMRRPMCRIESIEHSQFQNGIVEEFHIEMRIGTSRRFDTSLPYIEELKQEARRQFAKDIQRSLYADLADPIMCLRDALHREDRDASFRALDEMLEVIGR